MFSTVFSFSIENKKQETEKPNGPFYWVRPSLVGYEIWAYMKG